MKYQKSNFKSIGKLIAPLLTKHGNATIISPSKLLNIWETLVGESISKKAIPIRMKAIKGGEKNILYLGMTGPYLAELSLQMRDIIEKINSYYSKEVISKIKLQRPYDTTVRNVVEFDELQNFVGMKNVVPVDPKLDIAELEHALTKMKNNLTNSRKKNDTVTD